MADSGGEMGEGLRYGDLLNPVFQELLLAKLARDQDFLARARAIVQPRYFNALGHQALCEALFAFWDRHQRIPPPQAWLVAACQAGEALGLPPLQVETIWDGLVDTPDDALPRDFLAEQAVGFAQRAEAALAVGTAYQELRGFDLGELTAELRRILELPARFLTFGLDLRRDWAAQLAWDERELFPTGLAGMDTMMRGALRAGELCSILAPKKTGKTIWLLNIAVSLMQLGFHVLYYTLEMYPKDIARRMISILTGVPTNQLPQEPTAEMIRAVDALHEYTPGQLVVKELLPGPDTTVAVVESHALQVMQTTGVPHVIVCDYADLLAPSDRRLQEWNALYEIYQHSRALARRLGVPFITAQQTNAGGFNAPILSASHQSGSTKKSFVVEYLWGIEQSPEDYQLSRCTLRLLDSRHARKHGVVHYFVKYDTGQIQEVDAARYQARTASTTAA